MQTILFVGAGRHQRRAIRRVRELGVRVVAADANPAAAGFQDADTSEVTELEVPALVELGRRHAVDGVLTVASDRAVPILASVALLLFLPSITTETAHRMTNKIAMRRCLAEVGVPQPRFAAVR